MPRTAFGRATGPGRCQRLPTRRRPASRISARCLKSNLGVLTLIRRGMRYLSLPRISTNVGSHRYRTRTTAAQPSITIPPPMSSHVLLLARNVRTFRWIGFLVGTVFVGGDVNFILFSLRLRHRQTGACEMHAAMQRSHLSQVSSGNRCSSDCITTVVPS